MGANQGSMGDTLEVHLVTPRGLSSGTEGLLPQSPGPRSVLQKSSLRSVGR